MAETPFEIAVGTTGCIKLLRSSEDSSRGEVLFIRDKKLLARLTADRELLISLSVKLKELALQLPATKTKTA